MTQASFAFLASLQRGAVTLTSQSIPTGPRVRLSMNLGFNAGQQTAVRDLELHGPGEVTGIDPRAVIREWPTRGLGDAAPNDMALVEFDQADLPWRYTPFGDVTPRGLEATFGTGVSFTDFSNRLHPWIALIVLKQEEIARYTPPSDAHPLPVVETNVALPNLDQSWAWAHVQASDATSIAPAEVLQRFEKAPHTMVSRLLCPRRLEPRVAYRAFVVPSFERGRLRGLGLDPDDPESTGLDPTRRAWTKWSEVFHIELPVYYEWEFQTATAGSDFESLVRRLSAIALPGTVGTRAVDAAAPDAALPTASQQPLLIEGALKNPNATSPPPWNTVEQSAFTPPLTNLVNLPSKLLQGSGTTAVAPPLYGRWLAGDATVGDTPTPPWLDALNRDPRNRLAAGAGGAVAAKQEEKLLNAAWQQVDGLPEINEKLRFAQLARALAIRVHERWLAPAGMDGLYTLASPAFARMRSGTQTLARQFALSRLGRGPLEPAFRRLTRPRGPLGRRLSRIAANFGTTLLSRMNAGQIVAAPAPATPSLLQMQNAASPAPVSSAPKRPNFAVVRTIGPGSPPPAPTALTTGTADSADAVMFRAAMIKMLTSMRAPRAAMPAPATLAMLPVRTTILAALQPSTSVAASLAKRLRFAPGYTRATTDPLDPILAAPAFEQPMYEPLRDVSPEWILPMRADLPNNSVSLAVVNRAFIEAFMTGLNHEFARSLLWRRFPADQRGTHFRQFWDSSAYSGPRTKEQLRDVQPIDAWPNANKLGANSSRPPLPNNAEPLVLIIHGDLLQQFPRTVVYAARAATVNGLKEPVFPPDEMHPIFRGTLPGNFAFFGFELTANEARGNTANPDGWFFVLQEQPTEPRFGFDEKGPVVTPQKWGDLTWTHIGAAASPFINLDHPSPNTASIQKQLGEPDLSWRPAENTNSARLAYIALRRPPRVAIHAKDMLK